jgi:prepilin-type N-terminal cleavage/methylation domain-containing protein
MRVKDRGKRKGFTLVELAIVLVIIGFLLGMALKGKHLIDSAKVKSEAVKWDKISTALAIYLERYGQLPGDGCGSDTPTTTICADHPKDGVIADAAHENAAAWYQLITLTHILNPKDRHSNFGQDWNFWVGSPTGITSHCYLKTCLDLPGGNQADNAMTCALDKLKDDGINNTGEVRASPASYNQNTDCWSLNGKTDIWVKIWD